MKRLVFDIFFLGVTAEVSGISRFTVEVLRRILEKDTFDITLICSEDCEEDVLRNFDNNFINVRQQKNIKFQSKNIENYVLPSISTPKIKYKTFWGYLEERVLAVLPESKMLKIVVEKARAIKQKFISPYQNYPVKRERSPLLERLIRDSDAYFSPFNIIVPEIDVNPQIRKLQVVHDLIPVLFPHWFPQNWLKNTINWNLITPDVQVLADSQCTKNDLLRNFPHIPEDKITVIPLGADEHFHPCADEVKINSVLKKYGVPQNVNYILSVATLEIRKNFDHVIRSFAMLIEKYGHLFPNLRLVLTGKKGWLDKNIYSAYNKLTRKIRKRIIFTGYVDEADIPFLYNGASCFCYMSFYEGFGLPPLEAMQSGIPVITSNTSSFPEVVGDAGILLNPNDVDSLVNAFYRVLTDENLRNEMITKGLEQAKKFNWDDCVNIICDKIING
ncbi:MAG: glycosyltransferase family 4 protein [Planctomycetaceae bacterium]|nr:glycosyltransferase family 4 protein [Planctomycetaceae bacterium]